MNPVSFHARAAFALAILAALGAGCGQHRSVLAPRPDAGEPTLALKAAREFASTAEKPRYALSWQLKAGAADHYVYAVNPRSAEVVDASWQTTNATTFSLAVPARRSALERRSRPGVPTTFVVRAVDARGRMSHPEQISILDDNIAPMVQIVQPEPSDRSRAYVPSPIEIDWQGYDPDGVPTTQPYLYKYTLLSAFTPVTFATALADPDSVRRYYEPRDYEGWTPVGGIGFESPATKYTNLVPGNDYMFVVVAQDKQGAYTQVFSLNTNLLNMRVVFPGQGGPLLTLFNSQFTYTYPTGSYIVDPSLQVPITVGNLAPTTINWFASPQVGASIHAYRWALDIADVSDQTPRVDEATDLTHWSAPSATATSATVGPFDPGSTHVLYVDVTDTNGLRSLGMVRVSTIEKSLSRNLLIVTDTRLAVDKIAPGGSCVSAPLGRWPTQAEMDTFLFARGGFPWRCYPAGTMSSPGLFAGYEFDTIGTRGLVNPTIPLATLSQYAHVIWITDLASAFKTGSPGAILDGISSLRYMTQPGRDNTIAAYAGQGGRLWAVGGGVNYGSLISFNKGGNDPPTGPGAGFTASSLSPWNELIPGRMPYDVAGWRSEIKVTTGVLHHVRSLGRFEGTGSSYGALPLSLDARSQATDPLPPFRTLGDFYNTIALNAEYLSQPNEIAEGGVPTLDTLFQANGPSLVQPAVNPVNASMTIYRPSSGPPVVWSGLSLWDFQRAQTQQLVDFVLQQEWGMARTPQPALARSNVSGAWRPQRTTTR